MSCGWLDVPAHRRIVRFHASPTHDGMGAWLAYDRTMAWTVLRVSPCSTSVWSDTLVSFVVPSHPSIHPSLLPRHACLVDGPRSRPQRLARRTFASCPSVRTGWSISSPSTFVTRSMRRWTVRFVVSSCTPWDGSFVGIPSSGRDEMVGVGWSRGKLTQSIVGGGVGNHRGIRRGAHRPHRVPLHPPPSHVRPSVRDGEDRRRNGTGLRGHHRTRQSLLPRDVRRYVTMRSYGPTHPPKRRRMNGQGRTRREWNLREGRWLAIPPRTKPRKTELTDRRTCFVHGNDTSPCRQMDGKMDEIQLETRRRHGWRLDPHGRKMVRGCRKQRNPNHTRFAVLRHLVGTRGKIRQ